MPPTNWHRMVSSHLQKVGAEYELFINICKDITQDGNKLLILLELPDREAATAIDSQIDRWHTALSKLSLGIIKEVEFLVTTPNLTRSTATPDKTKLSQAQRVVMIASGKGGVGKSTLTVNLAVMLARLGYNVGIIDCDIYGASVNKMLGHKGVSTASTKGGMLIPDHNYGVKFISMGMLADPEKAIVWRGPMLSKMLHKMLTATDWEEGDRSHPLDILLLDTPPGTGDVQLTLLEKYKIDGAVVISTPQRIAITATHKSVDMLQHFGVTIYGMVENMGYMTDETGRKIHPFGQDNVQAYCRLNHIKLLATLPIVPELAAAADLGKVFWHQVSVSESTAFLGPLEQIARCIMSAE